MPKGDTPPPAPDSPGFRMPDASEVGRSMADIAERSQRIVTEWLKRQGDTEHAPDPLNIGRAFLEMTARLMANPARLVQAQIGFWQDYMTLWQNTARRMMGSCLIELASGLLSVGSGPLGVPRSARWLRLFGPSSTGRARVTHEASGNVSETSEN